MSTPFISICIPTYKRANFLKRLLDSITIQTYNNYEIIVTDDSPDDEIKLVVANYKGLSIKYFKNHPAEGTPNNWNIAMKHAAGDWIKLMHDDDWFSQKDSLAKFAEAAAVRNSAFIFSACNNIYSSGKEVNEYLEGWRKKMLEDNSLNLFFLNVIGHPSTVLHRKDHTILYDKNFKWVVDIDFYIRYLQKHSGYHYIPEMLINIGIDNSQVSSALHKIPQVEIPEYFSMLAKFPSNLLLKHEYVFNCVWTLVSRFKIKNAEMIREFGYSGTLPDKIQSIIDYQKNIPYFVLKQTDWSKRLMKHCFKKTIHNL